MYYNKLKNILIALLLVDLFFAFSLQAKNLVCPLPQGPQEVKRTAPDLSGPVIRGPDLNAEFKDMGTEFVNKLFFRTPDTLFRFLRLVYTELDKKIIQYKKQKNLEDDAIIMIFKGGNVLRTIAKNFLYRAPPKTRNYLDENFSPFFKRSDSDFGVIVNPQKLKGYKYEEIMREITSISLQELKKIREELEKNSDDYFDFMQYNDEMADKELATFFEEKIKDIAALKDPENPEWQNVKILNVQLKNAEMSQEYICPYVGGYDSLMDYSKDGSVIIKKDISKKPSWIVLSLNYTPIFSGAKEGEFLKYYLARAKVAFDYLIQAGEEVKRKSIEGELIDLGFSHKDSLNLPPLIEHIDSYLTDYSLTLKSTGESFFYKSENIHGLAEDLFGVLFASNLRLWDDKKYEKRVNRMFFLGLMGMATTIGLGNDRVSEFLTTLQDDLATPMENLFASGEINSELLSSLTNKLKAIQEAWPKQDLLTTIFEKTFLMLKDIQSDLADDDAENFKDYAHVINRNLEILSEVNELKEDFTLEEQDLYHTIMEVFFND